MSSSLWRRCFIIEYTIVITETMKLKKRNSIFRPFFFFLKKTGFFLESKERRNGKISLEEFQNITFDLYNIFMEVNNLRSVILLIIQMTYEPVELNNDFQRIYLG